MLLRLDHHVADFDSLHYLPQLLDGHHASTRRNHPLAMAKGILGDSFFGHASYYLFQFSTALI